MCIAMRVEGEGFTVYITNKSVAVETGKQTFETYYFKLKYLYLVVDNGSFLRPAYMRSILFFFFQSIVNKTVAYHSKFPEFLMSNMVVPKDFLKT